MIEWISHFWQENNKYEFNFGREKLIKSKLQVAFRWTVIWCIFNGALGFDFTKFIFDGAKNGSDAKFDPVKMNAIYQNMKRAMSALFMRQIYQISCLLFGGYFAIWSNTCKPRVFLGRTNAEMEYSRRFSRDIFENSRNIFVSLHFGPERMIESGQKANWGIIRQAMRFLA